MNTPHKPSAASLKLLLLACLLVAGAGATASAQPRRRPADATGLHEALLKAKRLMYDRDYKGAAEAYREAAARFPDFPTTWDGLGVALRRSGDFDGAIEAFRRSLKLRRNSETVRAELAYTLLAAGRRDEAFKEARRAFPEDAAAADQNYLSALLRLNHAFPEDDAPARALEEAEAALAADANNARAHLLKAQALLRITSRPTLADARDEEGRRLEEAAQSIEKYLALDTKSGGHALWQQQLAAARAQGEALRAPEASRTIFFQKELTTKAVINRRVEPGYTEEARRTQTFGSTRARAVLDADGSVQHVLVLGALPHGLTERVVEAARAMQFTPATKDGRPVAQFVILEYNFDIY